MQYKILAVQVKTTSTDKTYKKASLQGEDGVTHDVSVWANSPLYEAVLEGKEVSGTIQTNEKGYKNLLSDLKPPTGLSPKQNMVSQLVEKAQDRKQEAIVEIQSKKQEAISESQTRNEKMWAKHGACEIIANHPAFKDVSKENIQTEIKKLAMFIWKGKEEVKIDEEYPEAINPDDIPF